jgi:hypothetical protein
LNTRERKRLRTSKQLENEHTHAIRVSRQGGRGDCEEEKA